ncbi:hypothetical protein CBR_g11193 [Chara braunii]|uniref:Uncharacterized protein n=1 Tax=Chara braunii TaxID=69332 RepID=A0A388KQQ5_CHABU|nr:hypothetical protein CBR_g11193 [Chara braunii]|eukprot:GBG72263.1 hypothetical protein CBR_g11193 [Chara braunii]
MKGGGHTWGVNEGIQEVASAALKEVLLRRWLRCAGITVVMSYGLLVMWNLVSWWRKGIVECILTVLCPQSWPSLAVFASAQLLFILANWIVSEPEYTPSASAVDMLQTAWMNISAKLGLGGYADPANHGKMAGKLARARKVGDRAAFLVLVMASGVLGFPAYLALQPSPSPSSSHDFLLSSSSSSNGPSSSFAGAATTGSTSSLQNGGSTLRLAAGVLLGAVYALRHLYRRDWILSFPIIQKPFFFRAKPAFRAAASVALSLTIPFLVILEVLLWVSRHWLKSSRDAPLDLERACLYFLAGSFIVFCWEVSRHIVEIALTERHAFAPPPGSHASETSPSGLLLAALDFSKHGNQLITYLAFLDLCHILERNVDLWRRVAVFEESGAAYRQVMGHCLDPVNDLTNRIITSLAAGSAGGGGSAGRVNAYNATVQVSSIGSLKKSLSLEAAHLLFKDYQLCSWGARSAAALTAISRKEDAFGIAQLSGCNSAVMSSLLSCLLALEAVGGNNPSGLANVMVRPGLSSGTNVVSRLLGSLNLLSWDGGAGMGLAQSSSAYERIYALVDIVKTSIYKIVDAFGNEMLVVGSGKTGPAAVAFREWIVEKPLFGSRERLGEKISLFLEYKE